MEVPEKITLKISDWFDDARSLIGQAHRGTAAELDFIEQSIREKRMTLFSVFADGKRVGVFTALWFRRYDGEKILSVVHGVSEKDASGFSLVDILREPIEKIAKDCGCRVIEIHTDRKGLDRKMEKFGYEYQESVYSLKV